VFLSMVSSDTTRVKKAAVVARRSRESARIPMFFSRTGTPAVSQDMGFHRPVGWWWWWL
jgi:hypothetical protein